MERFTGPMPGAAARVRRARRARSWSALAIAVAFRKDRSAGEPRSPTSAGCSSSSWCSLSPHYPWYFLVLVPLLALHPSATAWVLTLGCPLLYDSRRRAPCWPGYDAPHRRLHAGHRRGPCPRRAGSLRRKSAINRRTSRERAHERAHRSTRAGITRPSSADLSPVAARRSGLPLPGDDQPLQSALHDLPAHLRGARAAGRHELGAVHAHRRPGAQHRPRGPARRRRADAGQGPAAHGALPEGPRRLRPVQHQRHGAHRQEGPRADRGRARRAARLARRRRRRAPSSPCAARTTSTASCATCAPSREMQAREGLRTPARLAVADRPQGDHRPAARLRAHRRTRSGSRRSTCSGSCSARTTPIGMARPDQALFERLTREEAAPPRRRRSAQAAALGISFNASGATEPGESLAAQGRRRTPGRCAGGPGR